MVLNNLLLLQQPITIITNLSIMLILILRIIILMQIVKEGKIRKKWMLVLLALPIMLLNCCLQMIKNSIRKIIIIKIVIVEVL